MENWSFFKTLVQSFGFPGALFLAIIYAMYRGWLRLGREATESEAAHAEQCKVYEDRLREKDEICLAVKAEAAENRDMLIKDRDYWRDVAVSNLRLAERSATATEKATAAAHTAANMVAKQ